MQVYQSWSNVLNVFTISCKEYGDLHPEVCYVRKLPVTCGLAVVFPEYSGFHLYSQLSQDLAIVWQKKWR